jgi:hypothetical protein
MIRIEWSGGDPAREFVFISGASVDATMGLMRGFLCTERADAQRFDVPERIAGYLPAGRATAGTSVPTGVISVGTLPLPETVKFSAAGLDVGYLFYSSQVMQQTEYR